MQPCDELATLQSSQSEAINAPYEAIFNHSGDGIVLLDEEYRIQLVNSAFARLGARTVDEITGKRLSSLVLADALQLETILGQVARSGEKQQIEVKASRSDGVILDLEIGIAPIHNAQERNTNLVCIVRDISARKKAEHERRESEHLLQSVIENIPVRVFWKDQRSIYRGCNSLHARSNGLSSPTEIIGKSDYDFLPERAPKWEADDREVMCSGSPKLDVEELTYDADGLAHWLRSSKVALRTAEGDVIGVLITVEDITERKVAELAIQEERNLLRTVIDAVPDSIYVKDLQHRMVLHNQAHQRVIELHSSVEHIGKTAFELYHPLLAAKIYADEERVLQSGTPIIEERLVRNGVPIADVEESDTTVDEDKVTLFVTKIPLRNLHGELIGLVGITRDISKLKAGEEALRRSEQELRESQKKLQMVLDTIPVRVFWKDRDSILQGCNRLFAQDAGYDNVAEFLAYEQANWLVKQISPDRYRQEDLTVIETGTPLLEYDQLFKRSTGEEMVIQTSKLPLRDEAGKIIGLLGVYMDITARREAEQALVQKYQEEQAMQGYLKALHDVTLQLTQTETLDNFYHDVVALGLKHFGFERMGFYLNRVEKAEATGTYGTDLNRQIISEYHLKLDLQNLSDTLKRAHQHGERFAFLPEATLYANGEQVGTGQSAIAAIWHTSALGWLSIDNGIHHQPITKTQLDVLALYAITVGSLLTRKQAETALRESEEKFRIFIESAPIATFVTDENGTIALVNCETERLFGYKRDELLGQSVKLLIPEAPSIAASFHSLNCGSHSERSIMHELRAKSNQTEAIELSARHKTGGCFPVDLQLRHIDTHPQPLAMYLVIDITQRKQAESALRQSLEQEKELSQLKSHFISMASHEFRTPLTSILSAAETISVYRGKMSVAQIDARLDKIRQQVWHMRDLMEDVLHLARMQSRHAGFKPTLGNLDLLCQDIIEEFESQPECQGRTLYSSSIQPTPLFFDEHLIRQVLNNLISNALKYSSPEKLVHVELTQDSTQMQLTVRDQGIGIPATDLKHIFEPFHRAQNVGTITGTGLGLSITKQAVELHNGTLFLESQVGIGTTFVVKLPIVSGKS